MIVASTEVDGMVWSVRWWRRRSLQRGLQRLLENTTSDHKGAPFAHDDPCSCLRPWAEIESTANGFAVAAVKSEHYSIMTNPELGPLVARCTKCHARYPYPWVVDTTGPMPFAFDQRPQPDMPEGEVPG